MTRGVAALHLLKTHRRTLKLHCPNALGAGWYVRTPVPLTLGSVEKMEQLPTGVTLKSIVPVPAKAMLVAHWVPSTCVSSSTEMFDATVKVGPADFTAAQHNDSRRFEADEAPHLGMPSLRF
jgi:hypothetical protein